MQDELYNKKPMDIIEHLYNNSLIYKFQVVNSSLLFSLRVSRWMRIFVYLSIPLEKLYEFT
jgi:hypothetical protein